MKKPAPLTVQVVLCETNPHFRGAIQTALRREGWCHLEICPDFDALRNHLDRHIVDVMLCSDDVPGMVFPHFIQDIRHRRIGRNPFSQVMALTGSAEPIPLRRLRKSGADRVAPKPISTGTVLGGVDRMARARTRYVASDDYVGPERRGAMRSSLAGQGLIEVPNIARLKLQQPALALRAERIILLGVSEVERKTLENSIEAIGRAEGIYRRCSWQRTDVAEDRLDLLHVMSINFASRYRNTAYHHCALLAGCLADVTTLLAADSAASLQQVMAAHQLLPRLVEALHKSYRDGPAALPLVREIVEEVNRLVQNRH